VVQGRDQEERVLTTDVGKGSCPSLHRLFYIPPTKGLFILSSPTVVSGP
jgi:hypothetical protein